MCCCVVTVQTKSIVDVSTARAVPEGLHLSSMEGDSGGASAAKEPGHFEVRTSSSQVTRMHFFPQKS